MDIHVVHGEKYSTVGVCIHECKESTGIHCAMSFYIMEFWYSGRLLEPIPSRCQGTVLLAFEVLILVLNSPLTLEITWPLWTQVLYLLNKIVDETTKSISQGMARTSHSLQVQNRRVGESLPMAISTSSRLQADGQEDSRRVEKGVRILPALKLS